MRKILNNLWSQRSQNVWLFLELIIVCFVAWTQLDPIVVRLYYRSLPSGLDSEQLVVANIIPTQSYDDMEKIPANQQYQYRESQFQQEADLIKRQLSAINGVEQVSFASTSMGLLARTDLFGSTTFPYKLLYAWQNDTIFAINICYSNDEHFFETYGIRPIAGCKTPEELSANTHGWIISRSLAEHFFGSPEAAINKELKAASFAGIDWGQPIVAVVNDVHVSEKDYNTWMVYQNNGDVSSSLTQNLVVLRLKPGVNPDRFAEEQNYRANEYASDHYAVVSFTTYDDIGTAKNQFVAPTLSYDFNLQIATAAFFLINLCLGVIGTFWMQTKRRTEESGIMRAFGATKRRVMTTFLIEGWVLATISMFIACVLYINYVRLGYGELCISPFLPLNQPDPTWVADKPLHFLIVSAIVYMIILCAVLIATAIPAWRICRSEITVALKDE